MAEKRDSQEILRFFAAALAAEPSSVRLGGRVRSPLAALRVAFALRAQALRRFVLFALRSLSNPSLSRRSLGEGGSLRHFCFQKWRTKPQGFTSLREAQLHSKGAAFSSHLHPVPRCCNYLKWACRSAQRAHPICGSGAGIPRGTRDLSRLGKNGSGNL